MIRAGLLSLALLPGVLAAQVDTTRRAARPDSTARDTVTARDTTSRRDTTARDTTAALLPAYGSAILQGPLPKNMRYTFTTDSMLLSGARTLSDLLIHIPGVFIARGGWYGQAEIALYSGRGPASLEVYWDGVPMLPLGRDSVYLDPARIPLGPVERVDVIILPTVLRVYLVTSQYRSTAPRTQVGIVNGLLDIADYRAAYSKRARSGLGIALLADWASISDGPPSYTTTAFGTSDIWVKADYVPPGGRVGASFQVSSSSWHRATGTQVNGWRQERRDRLLRVFVAERDDGLGWRLNATLWTTGVSRDTLVKPRDVSGAIIDVSQTWRTAAVTGTARLAAAGAPQQLEGHAGWMPIPPLTLAGDVRQSVYSSHRSGLRAFGAAGLKLPLGFSARAEVAWRRDVQAPFVTTDQVQRALDIAGWVGLDNRFVTLEVGRGRRDPFAPLGFAAGIVSVDSLNPTPQTDFLAAHAVLHIVPGFQLSGWYWDPVLGGGDFEPPRHAFISATFYSKFWRVFPSGIFALRVELAMESWSGSTLGGLQAGAPRPMTGASFASTDLEIQLAGVTVFWNVSNINIMRASYVWGQGYPRSAQQYGARWFFTN
ncbi:MAG TPA: Plug domain-containing protein [Gemmatimonadales bacterium]|nr:Plug domain-containing protein [Gemmatimonadales bacterium]